MRSLYPLDKMIIGLSCLSVAVLPSACFVSESTKWILIKFDTGKKHSNLLNGIYFGATGPI